MSSSRPAPAEPWLSVIMPTYNGARYLQQSLASVEREDLSGVEVIAVDDGSADATVDILGDAAQRMPIRAVSADAHGGWAAATNVGAQMARGTWVCMLHQDDVWIPGRLRSIRQAISRNPGAGLIVGASAFIDERGRGIGRWRLPWRGEPPSTGEVARRLYVQNWLAAPSGCIRADVMRSVGYLDEDLWYTADWDLWLKVIRHADVAAACGILSGFRVHASSQTIERSSDARVFESQMRAVQRRHRWAAGGRSDVIAAGEMSTLANVSLASLLHGHGGRPRPLLRQATRLRGGAWVRFARDSRLLDRCVPRLRVAVRSRRAALRRASR
jgi:glycosyltransferase involved in cell wall biosynthesis